MAKGCCKIKARSILCKVLKDLVPSVFLPYHLQHWVCPQLSPLMVTGWLPPFQTSQQTQQCPGEEEQLLFLRNHFKTEVIIFLRNPPRHLPSCLIGQKELMLPLKAECCKKMELPFLLKSRTDEELLLSRRQVLENLPTVPVTGTSQGSHCVPR